MIHDRRTFCSYHFWKKQFWLYNLFCRNGKVYSEKQRITYSFSGQLAINYTFETSTLMACLLTFNH